MNRIYLTLALILLLAVSLSACAPGLPFAAPPTLTPIPTQTPTITPTPAPTAIPALAQMAGEYYCTGMEYGMLAGFGQFTITPDGHFKDGSKDFSLAAAPEPNTYVFTDHPEFGKIVLQEGGAFSLVMKPGIQVAHADGGSVQCKPRDW